MASDFISISLTNPTVATQAQLLKQYISTLRNSYEIGGRVRAIMLHTHNGTVGAMEGTFQNDDCKQITEQVG
jgi:hypothetical protein